MLFSTLASIIGWSHDYADYVRSTSLGRYLTCYDSRRPRSSLTDQTPDQAYFDHASPAAVAA